MSMWLEAFEWIVMTVVALGLVTTLHVSYGTGLIKAMIDSMLGRSGRREATTRLSR